jgi:hypothetical protein
VEAQNGSFLVKFCVKSEISSQNFQNSSNLTDKFKKKSKKFEFLNDLSKIYENLTPDLMTFVFSKSQHAGMAIKCTNSYKSKTRPLAQKRLPTPSF